MRSALDAHHDRVTIDFRLLSELFRVVKDMSRLRRPLHPVSRTTHLEASSMTDRRSFVRTLPLALAAGLPALGRSSEETSAPVATLPANARVPRFEFVYECDATLS